MNKRNRSSQTGFLLGIISGCLILLVGGYSGGVSEAGCPPLLGYQGWAPNSNVDYVFSGFSGAELNLGIGPALSNWTFNNQLPGVNCSNVTFLASITGTGAYIISAANDVDPVHIDASATTMNHADGGFVEVSITFFHFAASHDGVPTWNRDGSTGYYTFVKKVMLHEAGHTMGLNEIPNASQSPGDSVMNSYSGTNDSGNNMASEVKVACDDVTVLKEPQYLANCDPSPTPCPPQDCSGGTNPDGSASYGCYWDSVNCDCECSPIILDVLGKGFHLTDIAGGVSFDLHGDGVKKQMAWTAPGSGDAFLALDRNGNGRIDDGTELFGNFTAQPNSDHRNGFIALAEFDKPENGGNGDGVIDKRDRVYASLLLWRDANQNGISEASELHSLASESVEAIDLRYRQDRYRDQYGNAFKYRAAVHSLRNDHASHWAYDVFLLIAH